MLPSIATLNRAFPGQGRTLRLLLENPAIVRLHPATIARVRECFNPPEFHDMRLHALNAEAGTFGVEAIQLPSGWMDYLNTGDIYGLTIVRYADGRYRVASVGSIIERMPESWRNR